MKTVNKCQCLVDSKTEWAGKKKKSANLLEFAVIALTSKIDKIWVMRDKCDFLICILTPSSGRSEVHAVN